MSKLQIREIPHKVGYQICLSDSSVPAVVPKPIDTSEATGKPISLVGLFAEAPIGSNEVRGDRQTHLLGKGSLQKHL